MRHWLSKSASIWFRWSGHEISFYIGWLWIALAVLMIWWLA